MAYQISPLFAALQQAQYTPDENPFGVGAQAIAQASPMLYNPYASTGSNAAYTVGAGLLSGLLGGLAKRESASKNADLFAALNSMRGAAPEEMTGIIQQNPRLSNIGLMMMQDQMDKQAEAQSQQAAFDQQLRFEKTKMQELGPLQMQQDLQKAAATGIANNPYAADDIMQAVNKYGALPQPGALQPAGAQPEVEQGNLLTDALVTKAAQDIGPVSPETKVNLQSTIDQAPLLGANRYQEILRETKNPSVAEKLYEKEIETQSKENEKFDEKLTTLAGQIQKNANTEGEYRSALTQAGDTGGFGPTEFARKIGLGLEASLLGDAESAQRLAARSRLEALNVYEAGKVAAEFAGADSDKDREFYLKTTPNAGLRPEANQELVDRIGRLNLLDKQTYELLSQGKAQGLSVAQTEQAIKKLNTFAPLFVNDTQGNRIINPARVSLDPSSVNLRDISPQQFQKKNDVADSSVSPPVQGEVSGINAMMATPSVETPPDNLTTGNKIGNFLGNVGNTLSFGYGPQLGGASEVVGSEILDALGIGANRSIGENYALGKDDTRALLDKSKTETPKISAAGSVVGALGNPVNKLKTVQKAYQMTGLAGVGARAGTNVVLNAISGEENKASAKGAATTSVVVDAVMSSLGAGGKVLSNTLRSTLGINRADMSRAMANQSIKGKTAEQVKEAANGLKNGLNLALKENPLNAVKALKNDGEVYLHVLGGAQQGIKNRLDEVSQLVKQADATKPAITLAQEGKKRLIASAKGADKKAYEQAYNKELNDWIQYTKAEGGPTLVNMQKEKVARNLTYKIGGDTAQFENSLNKAITDDLRLTIERAASKALPEQSSGVIRKLNLETRDLINTSKAVFQKIPGASQGTTLEDARRALFTTGGAGLAGGNILAGLGGVDPMVATGGLLATYLNPARRALSLVGEKPLRKASEALATPESRMAISALQGGPDRELPNFSQGIEMPPSQANTPAPPVRQIPQMQQAQQRPQKLDVSAIVNQQPPLIRAMISTESSNKAGAVSPKGAQGLMQIMPEHYKRLGITDPKDPEQNIKAGTIILQEEFERFKDLRLALAAYNAGSPAVLAAMRRSGAKDWYSIAPYLPAETRAYVPKVLGKFSKYTNGNV